MPSPPYAKLLVSRNGGALTSGGLVVLFGDAIQLSGESTVGWQQQRWDIVYYPVGYGLPSGWTFDSSTGSFFSTAVVPPPFTLPPNTTWGRWMLRLRINDALTNSSALQQLTDSSTAL